MAFRNAEASQTLPMVRSGEAEARREQAEIRPKEASGHRGAGLAAQRNKDKAAVRKETGSKFRRNPATADVEYTENQTAFMLAMEDFKRATGTKFPNMCDYLEVAESLGWERQTRTWPSDRLEVAEADAAIVAA